MLMAPQQGGMRMAAQQGGSLRAAQQNGLAQSQRRGWDESDVEWGIGSRGQACGVQRGRARLPDACCSHMTSPKLHTKRCYAAISSVLRQETYGTALQNNRCRIERWADSKSQLLAAKAQQHAGACDIMLVHATSCWCNNMLLKRDIMLVQHHAGACDTMLVQHHASACDILTVQHQAGECSCHADMNNIALDTLHQGSNSLRAHDAIWYAGPKSVNAVKAGWLGRLPDSLPISALHGTCRHTLAWL